MPGKKVIKVGFDFGTNTSVITAHENGKDVSIKPDIIFTVVGYAKPNILPDILPDNKKILFGEDAIKDRLYVNLRWPLDKGTVVDFDAAKDFVSYIKSLIDKGGEKEIWMVVGSPARVTQHHLRNLRQAMGLNFDRFLIVPEPFLAVLGLREEARLKDPSYQDPTRNSLVVDIGAGTTDLCIVQGYYPGPDEQMCIPKAGNDIDLTLRNDITARYPDVNLHSVSVTRIKEENSFVGSPPNKVVVKLYINGYPREVDITDFIGNACEIIIDDIVKGIQELIRKVDVDVIEPLLNNIMLTGGGSLIRGICEFIEDKLHNLGYVSAKVTRAKEYKRLVSKGALKIALAARDDQWQMTGVEYKFQDIGGKLVYRIR